MSDLYDVAVIGAGPAGSAAALRLAADGWRVALVDREAFPRHKPCGDYLNAGARAALGRLGVLPALRAGGGVDLAGMRVFAQDGTAFAATFPGAGGMAVRRMVLDAALVEAAARTGARLVEGFRVDTVALDGGARAVAGVRGGRAGRVRARLVIGADGMRSRVARALGLAAPPPGGRFGVGAYVEGLPEPAGPGRARYGEMHAGRGFCCGIAWFADGTANTTMALPGRWLRGWNADADARFRALLGRLPGLAGRLETMRRVSPFSVTGPLAPGRRRASAERALLVGDAAGFLDPFTGQGVAAALWSAGAAAAMATAALADGDLSARRLRAYDRARREFAVRLAATQIVHGAVFRTPLFPRIASRLARRPRLADRLLASLGGGRPVSDLLSPALLLGMVW